MNDLTAGIFSGFVQTFFGHPLDTIKVLKQSNIELTRKLLTPRSLYKGFLIPFTFSGIINGTIFGINQHLYEKLNNHYMSGFLAGSASTIIVTPMELYKIRKQENLSIKNIFPFKGFVSTFCRESIATSMYFGSYKQLQSNYNNPLFNGGVAGVLSWSISYNFDTIKTRIQSDKCKTMLEGYKMGKLWSGIKPCLIRSFIVNGVGFYVYEAIKKHWEN